MLVWKYSDGNTFVIVENVADVAEYVKSDTEKELGNKYTLECIEMKEEEFYALPEFEGF